MTDQLPVSTVAPVKPDAERSLGERHTTDARAERHPSLSN